MQPAHGAPRPDSPKRFAPDQLDHERQITHTRHPQQYAHQAGPTGSAQYVAPPQSMDAQNMPAGVVTRDSVQPNYSQYAQYGAPHQEYPQGRNAGYGPYSQPYGNYMQPIGGIPMSGYASSGPYDQNAPASCDPAQGYFNPRPPQGQAQNHQYSNDHYSTHSSLTGAAGTSARPNPGYGTIGHSPQNDRQDPNGKRGYGHEHQGHGQNGKGFGQKGSGKGSGPTPPAPTTPEEDDEGTTVDAAVWFIQAQGRDQVPFTKGEVLKAYTRMIKDLPEVKPATGAGQSGHYGAYVPDLHGCRVGESLRERRRW